MTNETATRVTTDERKMNETTPENEAAKDAGICQWCGTDAWYHRVYGCPADEKRKAVTDFNAKYSTSIPVESVSEIFEAGYKAGIEQAGNSAPEPLDVVLFCPRCKFQHVDKAEPDTCQTCGYSEATHKTDDFKQNAQCVRFLPWLNPSHKSHRCLNCNIVWRPADVPTNGVEEAKTVGESDTKDFGINPHEPAPEGESLESELDWIYSQEQNVQLSCFWDAGWTLQFGDVTNGFTGVAYFDSTAEVVEYLRQRRSKIAPPEPAEGQE